MTTATVKRAHLAGERGDDRSRAGAGSAAQTGGDEHHVRAFQGFDDLVGIFERGLAADVGIGARAQAVGQLHAELNLHRSFRTLQRLQVGVGDNELHAFQVRLDHAIDGVAAAAANSDDLDLGAVQQLFVEVDADVVFRLLLVVEVFDHLYLSERVSARLMLTPFAVPVEHRAAVPDQILPNVLRALLGKECPDLCS